MAEFLPEITQGDNETDYESETLTITATVSPDNSADNTGLDWSMAFKDPSSAWATGKTLTDYMTLTPSGTDAAGSKKVSVKCLKPFGEQVVITATSQDNPEVTASCTADFAQRIESATLKFGDLNVSLGGDTNVKWELNPNGTGVGGATSVTSSKSDVYTLAEDFTYTVTAESSFTEESYFKLNGTGVTYTAPGDITESGLTFNYALFDTMHMFILDRFDDFYFADPVFFQHRERACVEYKAHGHGRSFRSGIYVQNYGCGLYELFRDLRRYVRQFRACLLTRRCAMGKGLNTVGKIVAWVLAVLLIVGVAGVIVYFVAKEEGADYFVEYNGEKYLGNAEGGKLDITSGEEYRFEVKSLTGENVNFDVKVTSNPANNFEYTVDGKLCVWNGSDEKANDYTDIFNVQKDETGFTLAAPEKFGIYDVLQAKYPGQTVDSGSLDAKDYFLLTVSVGKSSVAFWFGTSAATMGITLSPSEIVF